ncbi:MAG TPA: response regulator [Chthoniobacterales bacterium]
MTTAAGSAERKRSFLVVDDEPFIVEYVRQVLSRLGHNVQGARDGEEAWTTFERHRDQIDVVITDIVMPGSFDGFALAGKIQRSRPGIPVVFMTGALPDDDPRALQLNEKRLLLKKPFFPAQLMAILREQLAVVDVPV